MTASRAERTERYKQHENAYGTSFGFKNYTPCKVSYLCPMIADGQNDLDCCTLIGRLYIAI